ncbi:BlaI/MecI/CopY family transcriptional regulator [soil metagenome]
MEIRRFDLDAQGLARVVGELEARILEVVWARGTVTVREVTEALGPSSHHKTIMTIMNRMVEKGLLNRQALGQGRTFTYNAASDRETFMSQVVSRVIAGLMTDFGQPTMAHFVEGIGSEQLAELEALIQRKREANDE